MLDFHNAPGKSFSLVRPGSAGSLFLRRLSDGQELTVPASSQKVELALLTFTDPRIEPRGAAHQAFSLIFSLPFDATREGLVLTAPPPVRPTPSARRPWILGAVGAGTVISAAVGGALLWDASRKADAAHGSSGERTAYLNDRIDTRDTQAMVAFGLAGAGLTAGTLLWCFYHPSKEPPAMARGGHPGRHWPFADHHGGTLLMKSRSSKGSDCVVYLPGGSNQMTYPRSCGISLWALALAAVACVRNVPIEGQSCPCPEGYVCCTTDNTCLPHGKTCGGAGQGDGGVLRPDGHLLIDPVSPAEPGPTLVPADEGVVLSAPWLEFMSGTGQHMFVPSWTNGSSQSIFLDPYCGTAWQRFRNGEWETLTGALCPMSDANPREVPPGGSMDALVGSDLDYYGNGTYRLQGTYWVGCSTAKTLHILGPGFRTGRHGCADGNQRARGLHRQSGRAARRLWTRLVPVPSDSHRNPLPRPRRLLVRNALHLGLRGLSSRNGVHAKVSEGVGLLCK